jgi:hypothetical protein
MHRFFCRFFRGAAARVALIASLLIVAPAIAQDGSAQNNAQLRVSPQQASWYFQTSLYTQHFSPDPKHVNHNVLLNLEYQRADNWLVGGAQFRNSFGQPSQYVYFGKIFRPLSATPNLYLKLTAGVVHGYKGEFRDKIPLNGNGIAPGILPAIGYDFYGRRFATEVIIFGTAGLMWTVGARF